MQNQKLKTLTNEQTTQVTGGCLWPETRPVQIVPPRETITPDPHKQKLPIVITLALGEDGGDWKPFI
jgi:hypothetical protein